jgi:type I restriction enzyme, S subunit
MKLTVDSKQWLTRKLGEICSISTGKLNANAAVEDGEYPFFTCSREVFAIDVFAFDCEAILLAGNNAVGDFNVKHYHGKFNAYQRTYVITINKGESLLYKYLYLQVETALKDFKIKSVGAGTKFLKIDMIKDLAIHLPPLHEQKRIVAIVDEAFESIDIAIENTKKNLTNARELFESYRNSILTQNNHGWKATTLGAEIELMTGFPFKSNRYTESEESIRLLRGDNIVQGSLRWDDVKKWPESEITEFVNYQLRDGDIVLAMDRPWVKSGLKHAMISSDDLPCLLVQRTACIRGTKDIKDRFLMYLIGSHSFIRHILSNQTGIGVPHISGKQIQSFGFSKPPLATQILISDSLDELRTKTQRLEAIYQEKLTALTELKQSILQKAFTGELTADSTNQTTKKSKEVIAA